MNPTDVLKNIRNIFLIIYFFGGVLAILISIKYGFNREMVGIIFLFGTLLSFIIQFKPKLIKHASESINKPFSRFVTIGLILWVVLSSASIVVLSLKNQIYTLPLVYFVLISFLVFIISLQIFYSKKHYYDHYIIILEILILSSIVSASYLFLFPGPYGNDASYHISAISSILYSGNMNEIVGHYSDYPLFHLMLTNIILITGVSLKIAQFVLAIIQIMFLMFMYSISKKIFNNEIALISILLLSFTTYLTVPKYSYFPGSFSSIFLMLILYFFFNPSSNNFLIMKLLLIFSFLVSIFIHPLTPLIVISVLSIFFISVNIMKFASIKISYSFIFLIVIATLSKWMSPLKNGSNLFSILVNSIENALMKSESITDSVGKVTLSSLHNFSDVVLYDLGFILVLFFGILGAFLILNSNVQTKLNDYAEKQILLAIATLVLIPIPYALAIFFPQSLPARWFPFIEVFAGLLGSISIYSIYHQLYHTKLKYISSIILVIIVFFSITSPIVNPNSIIYAQTFSNRAALTQSETNAANYVNSFVNISEVHGNSKYIHFINRSIANPNHYLNPEMPKSYQSGIILFRKEDAKSGFVIPLFGHKNKLLEIIYPTSDFYNRLCYENKIYDNKNVIIYNAH